MCFIVAEVGKAENEPGEEATSESGERAFLCCFGARKAHCWEDRERVSHPPKWSVLSCLSYSLTTGTIVDSEQTLP